MPKIKINRKRGKKLSPTQRKLLEKYKKCCRFKDGAILFSKRKNFVCPGFANNVVDKVGAGDAMLAITSLCFKAKVNENLTLYLGSLAGAHSVQSISNSDPVTKGNIQKIITHQLID